MPIERKIENSNKPIDEVKDTALQKKAKYATMLTRGYIVDRMHVDNADPNMHYEWVLNDQYELHRKDALGFKFTTGKAGPSYLTNSGADSKKVVGDCVLMELPMDDYVAFTAAQAELAASRMGTRSGENTFTNAPEDRLTSQGIRDVGLPTIDDPSKLQQSSTRVVSGDEIARTLQS